MGNFVYNLANIGKAIMSKTSFFTSIVQWTDQLLLCTEQLLFLRQRDGTGTESAAAVIEQVMIVQFKVHRER